MEFESRVPAIDMEAAQKVLTQQLALIIHAHSCMQKDQHEGEAVECKLPYCKETKQVLGHIRGCFEGPDCIHAQCTASQQLIAHYKSCSQKKRCPVCGPVFISQINNAMSSMTH